MKNIKTISNIVFVAAIISLPLGFALSCLIGEVDVFGIAGSIRYSWVMYLFIPISLLSFACGIAKRRNGQKARKDIIIACITIPLLLFFGSDCWIMKDSLDYSIVPLNRIEEKADVDLPEDVKVATMKYEEYTLSYAKLSGTNADELEHTLSKSSECVKYLSLSVKGSLPYMMQAQLGGYEYFRFYNCTTKSVNVDPTEPGKHNCVLIAYDVDLGRLMILDYYTEL